MAERVSKIFNFMSDFDKRLTKVESHNDNSGGGGGNGVEARVAKLVTAQQVSG